MKLAFSTLGCPDWSFETIVEKARSFGFRAVEIRGIQKELDTGRLTCFLPDRQADTERLLRKNGVSVCGVGTSCAFHDASQFPRALAEGKAAVDVCARMGIPFIRVFGNQIPREEEEGKTIRRVALGIEELCAYAERTSSVQVLLEVHGDFNTVERLAEVAELLRGHGSFGILWDIEHSYRARPGSEKLFYRSLKPLIRHVHVKDCRRENGTYSPCLPGEGEIPIGSIVRMLLDGGYGGYFSFEWEKRWNPKLPEPEVAFPRFVEEMHTIVYKGQNTERNG